MQVILIVATSANNVIGVEGGLPWHLPDDLRRFKQLTTGKPIVMWRLTYESIGRALPDRQNIVVSRNPDYAAPGCNVVGSRNAAIAVAGGADELMIIGGGHIYREFLPLSSRIYMTRVHADIEGDTYFSGLREDEWQESSKETHPSDEHHAFAFDIIQLDRIESN